MTVVTILGFAVGFFSKKSTKSPAKMKTLKVEFKNSAPAKTSPKTAKGKGKAKPKPMDFSDWIDHYVEMSKGNPV